MVNQEWIVEQLKTHDSFYVYETAGILQAVDTLQTKFPQAKFLYSAKTNPHPQVVKTITAQGVGIDAASSGEVALGVANGVAKAMIQYSAPGKTEQDIAKTLPHATLIADSLGEIHRIAKVAQEQGVVAEIGVRLNPNFTFDGDGGACSKFGIDEDQFVQALPQLMALSHIQLVGLHVHIRSQERNGALIARYYEKVLALAETMPFPLHFVNLGSGIGIPYALEDTPVDLDALSQEAEGLMTQFHGRFPRTQIYIESGRYLVGKSGWYVTKVLDKKVSHGTTFVVLANTLNGFVRPSMAQMVEGYNPNAQGCEPLYTGRNAFPITAITQTTELETVTLVGNLCTAADVIAKGIPLPKLNVGDAIVLSNAGSYAAVLSPMQFSSQTPPAELVL